jgi:hypothetical protein
MPCPTPAHLLAEHRALETEIREAFKGVTRDAGVSWSEAMVMDDYGSDEGCAEARASDADRSWTELADDTNWDAGAMGTWSFLDGIGFRYYLPAAMIRTLNAGYEACSSTPMDNILTMRPTHPVLPLLDARQRACIARFVRFMIARDDANPEYSGGDWARIYERFWKRFDEHS